MEDDVIKEITKKDIDKLLEMPSLIKDEPVEKCEKMIFSFADKFNLAEQLIEVMPLYYDNSNLFWRFHTGKKKWEIIDEIDLMNSVTYSSYANTISSKERSEILQALKQVARQNKPKEAKPSWLQFDDEVIDIETGLRFKATSEYFLTNPIPYKLGEDIETPCIDKLFLEWVGKDFKPVLYEIIAFCLLRTYPLHRLFCFIGSGLNGKSCFLRLIKKFLGSENICSSELDTILKSRFEVTKLHKKLVCMMGETDFNQLSKTSLIKKLTGEDVIGFEYKNKTPFDDSNYAKILIATNNLPTTDDKTEGFYRRWNIIDFPNKFSEDKDVLESIPELEYNNLALKSIGVLIELLKDRKFTKEGSIEERKKRYEDKSNPLEKFMKEFIDNSDSNGHIWKYEFEKRLNEWCKENRFRELSEAVIGKKMKELGIEQAKRQIDWTNENKQIRCWMGIKWIENGKGEEGEQTE